MLATQWVCRSCIRSLARRPIAQILRRASTTTGPNALPAALLERARKLTREHDDLQATLANAFDSKTAKRAGELAPVAAALRQWEASRTALAELEDLLAEPEAEADPELRALALDDAAETTAQLDRERQNLALALTPKHPFADMPCLIEIRPGPGGLEGRFFADTLFHMYERYCAAKGYRARVLKYEAVDELGETGDDGEIALQEAVLEVQDAGAYGVFRGEAGMHRVQRVPSTEKSGRTHTSAVAVWVLPSFPENGNGSEEADFDDPESDFYINPVDVRTEKMRARGAGGQHVNKTESAIRLTHVPTGTTVSMQDSRSQQRNRESAWKVLRSRIAQQRREAREEATRNLKSSVLAKAQVTRGDKIRTYNYQQNRCTDHRCGLDIYNLPSVIEGGDALDKVFEAVKSWFAEKDIQAVLAEEEAKAQLEKAESAGSKK